MNRELDPQIGVGREVDVESVDGFEHRHRQRAREGRGSGFLDAARGVVGRELDQIAERDAGDAAVVNVDRLVDDRVEARAREPAQALHDVGDRG
jgi:hypothetical protein